MDLEVIEECKKLSEEEKITFAEVVKRLSQAGIDSYSVDLLAANNIYHSDNQAYTSSLKIKTDLIVGEDFNESQVIETIRAIQAGKIGYQEFLKRVMKAGTIGYFVFIKGRKAIYFGKKGEHYTEPFPSK